MKYAIVDDNILVNGDQDLDGIGDRYQEKLYNLITIGINGPAKWDDATKTKFDLIAPHSYEYLGCDTFLIKDDSMQFSKDMPCKWCTHRLSCMLTNDNQASFSPSSKAAFPSLLQNPMDIAKFKQENVLVDVHDLKGSSGWPVPRKIEPPITSTS